MSICLAIDMQICVSVRRVARRIRFQIAPSDQKKHVRNLANEDHFAHRTTEAESFSAEMIYGRADVNPRE